MSSLNQNNPVQADASVTHEDDLKSRPAPDHIDRLARAIAKGGAPIPVDVDRATKLELLQKVNKMRRARLVNYVSGVIAKDIFAARRKEK